MTSADVPQEAVEAALLPCPFCGGNAKLINTMGFWENQDGYGESGCRAVCIAVGCSGAGMVFFGDHKAARAIAAWNRRPSPAPDRAGLIEHMANQFLRWKLPDNFSPDAGISFKPTYGEGTAFEGRHTPVGTNLLDYTQAKAMVLHMLEGLPATLSPDAKDQRIAELEATIAGFDRLFATQNGIVHDLSSRAEAAEAELAMLKSAGGVEVKPLVWSASGIDAWTASSILSGPHYVIFSEGDPTFVLGSREYPTLDAAKAAAQADYEQRIKSALIAAPQPEVTALVEALREANAFILAPAEDLKEGVLARIRAALAQGRL